MARAEIEEPDENALNDDGEYDYEDDDFDDEQ
jgi:hypothetical protein